MANPPDPNHVKVSKRLLVHYLVIIKDITNSETKNRHAGEMFLRKFQCRRAFIAHLPFDKSKMMIKKFTARFAIGSRLQISLSRLFSSLFDVEQKPQLELCVPLTVRFLIASYRTRWCSVPRAQKKKTNALQVPPPR